MFDIRQICTAFKEIHSKYYIDTNGCAYTSLSPTSDRFLIDGKRSKFKQFRKMYLHTLNKNNNMIMRYEETDYFMLYDGTILRRLKTSLNDSEYPRVSLFCVYGKHPKGCNYLISRLVAGCFIGDIEGKEVHHIDQNTLNNNIINLQILTPEEHRDNHAKNHLM